MPSTCKQCGVVLAAGAYFYIQATYDTTIGQGNYFCSVKCLDAFVNPEIQNVGIHPSIFLCNVASILLASDIIMKIEAIRTTYDQLINEISIITGLTFEEYDALFNSMDDISMDVKVAKFFNNNPNEYVVVTYNTYSLTAMHVYDNEIDGAEHSLEIKWSEANNSSFNLLLGFVSDYLGVAIGDIVPL